MEGEVLTKEQCLKALKNYLKTNEFYLKSFLIEPLSSQSEGLIGEQHIIKIQYQFKSKDCSIQFFAKILNGSNSVMFEISKSINAYEKESFYYEKLVPLLASKNLDMDISAKSYFCEPYVIVLEDLSLISYKGTTKNKPLDISHCKKSLETLAKFHVAPIVYEIKKTEELGKTYSLNEEFKDILEDKVFSGEENGATRFFKSSLQGFFKLVDLLPENGVKKKDFCDRLEQVVDQIMNSNGDELKEFRSTLLHGDLWSNNFLFRYSGSEIIDCKLIDFQTLKYGPAALDVLQFILTNTRRSFRDRHRDELLSYYYDYFCSLLAKEGVKSSSVMTEVDFKGSCRALALPAKIQAVIDRSITLMADKFALSAGSEEAFSKFLFEERDKFIVDAFNTNSYFRELMIEDLEELRDLLFLQ